MSEPPDFRLEQSELRTDLDVNAAARLHDISYSKLMAGLKRAGIDLDRKSLAELAARDLQAFGKLVESAKAATTAQPAEAKPA